MALLGYFLLGILGGGISGLLGIGGGLVVVPGLVFIFRWGHIIPPGLLMHVAAGTSLAAMIASASSSAYAHYKRGAQIWPVYQHMFWGIVVGAVAGVILAKFLHSRVLEIFFGVLMILVAIFMFSNVQPAPHRNLPGKFPLFGVSSLIGMYSGLLGIGGGAFSVPFLMYCRVPMRNIIGISVSISFTVAVVGAIAFILTGWSVEDLPHGSWGFVYWPAALSIAVISPIFALMGATLSHRLPVIVLRRILAICMILVGFKMMF